MISEGGSIPGQGEPEVIKLIKVITSKKVNGECL